MANRSDPTVMPSEAQLEVLDIVWDRGTSTVGEIWRVFRLRRPVARNTVLTLVARLEEKGWLRRRTDDHVLRYDVVVPRQTGRRRIARRFVDTAFRGSTEGLIMALLEGDDLSEGEAERIRAMLEKARREKRGRNQS